MSILCAYAAGGLTVLAVYEFDRGDGEQSLLSALAAVLCLYVAVFVA